MTGTNHIPPRRREGQDTRPIYPTRATPDAALWRAVAPKPTWWDQGAGGLNWSPGTLPGKGHSALAEVRWRLRPRRRRRGCCCGNVVATAVVVGDHARVRVSSGDSDVSLGSAGVEGHGHEGVAQGMGVMRLVTLPARATRPTIRAAPRRSSRIPLFVRSTGPEVRSPMAAPTAHAVRWAKISIWALVTSSGRSRCRRTNGTTGEATTRTTLASAQPDTETRTPTRASPLGHERASGQGGQGRRSG